MDLNRRPAVWTGRVITALAAFPFLMSAVMKLSRNPQVLEGFPKMGIPSELILTIGILELGSALLYLIPATTGLGAILLTGYLGGAIMTHLRVGEAVPTQVVIGVLIWLGLWLREPVLRKLIPWRCTSCHEA
jgi:hypothetical protein